MNNGQPGGLGANESAFDSRTLRHDTTMAVSLTSGGYQYFPEDINHQHNVGICTAISLTQNANKAIGKRFSADFQYLLQKKYYDLNWLEGSSIFNALKVGKNFGFLPESLFTWVNEQDRLLPYSQYIAKLQAIPNTEIQRLLTLCTDRLTGYAQLATDPQSLAKGILDSKSGVLCRYAVGQEWWQAPDGHPSWATADIDPLRPPQNPISGHAIGAHQFNYLKTTQLTLNNTWGILWNDQNKGQAHINHVIYPCSEAWMPYYGVIPVPLPPTFIFTQDLVYGQSSEDVRQLQKRLNVFPQTGYYGDLTRAAVLKYQLDKNIPLSWYERYILKGSRVGFKTRQALNS